MCETAVQLGYRHFDTASGYGNEEAVGRAIRESGLPRSEVFVTTKLNNNDHGRVKAAFEDSLQKLDLEYIDLYLLHWPVASGPNGSLQPEESPTYVETWKEMEKLVETGKVKTLGVSNFSIKTLEVLLASAKIVPAVNQVQMHPSWPQDDLIDYSNKKGIHTTAYTPLGRADSPFFKDADVLKVAEKYSATAAQAVLSWNVARGVSVIPKSENPDRLKSNFQILELSVEDFDVINNLHKKPGMHRQLITSAAFNWTTGVVCGWTLDQLGWKLNTDGTAYF